ncbi:MAG: DUF4870 domain-containing protein [Candidatus Aminicenantaceae bacterium]
MEQKEERNWGMFCHLAALAGFIVPFGNVIGPLIIWLIKKDESEFVNEQGKESLNFQISFSIYAIVAAILIVIVIGIILLIGLGIAMLILVIVAAIKASNGEKYSYPLTIRFIK